VNKRHIVITVAPGLLVLAVAVVVEIAKAWALGKCDPKLGCLGGVQFAAFIGAVAAVASWIGMAGATLLQRRTVARLSWRSLAVATLAIASVLSLLLRSVGYWPVEIAATVLLWSALAGALGLLAILLVGHERA
jgi:hypothetical protein